MPGVPDPFSGNVPARDFGPGNPVISPAVSDAGNTGPVRVQVSARTLTWPRFCACCTGPADAVFYASYTRVTGKRVIRTDSRDWSVPYCNDCLHHAGQAERADQQLVAEQAAAAGFAAGGIIVGILLVVVGTCCISPIIGGAFSQQKAKQPPSESQAILLTGLVISGGLGVLVAVAGFFMCSNGMAEAKRSHSRRMSSARDGLKPACCGLYHAVEYEGWSGSIHTFTFQNAVYAEEFKQDNAKKLR